MKVKKYMARTMPEAMQKIKSDLGNNAVILNSKEIKSGGFLGLFQTKQIEVVAALDKELPLVKPVEKNTEIKINSSSISKESSEQKVLNELKYLRNLLATKTFQSDHQFPPVFEHAFQYLVSQEVEEEIAKDIIQAIHKQYNEEETISTDKMKSLMQSEIQRKIAHTSFGESVFDHKIIQFVGPTGVGKTTTLAKIAAKSMLRYNKSIAFITTDTYRIAAIEQLKTYATILDVPLEVAYSIKDYQQALEKFSSYDIIFVDSAGRNFRDQRYITELKQYMDPYSNSMENILVLSLTAKTKDIMDIYHTFKSLHIDHLIFTKIDETVTYGSLLNICAKEDVGITYLANGQDVPDDLMEAKKEYISNLIVSRYTNA